MSRNGSGTFSVTNSFSSGATISSSAMNANFTDVGSEITNSLPRDGQAGMTGQFKASSGSSSAPGITYTADSTTGFRRSAAGATRHVSSGTDGVEFSSSGVNILTGGLTVASGATVTAGGLTVSAGAVALGTGGVTVTSGGLTVSAGTVAAPASTTAAASLNIAAGTAPTSPNDGDFWATTAALFARIAGTTYTFFTTAGGTLIGKLTTLASASGGAGLNLPHGAAPSAPVNGDVWTTTAGTYARINSATVGPYLAGSFISMGTSATTSGSNIDVTSIPSTAKKITIAFSGVSTNSTTNVFVQIGAGSITSSGYLGGVSVINGSTCAYGAATSGFFVWNGGNASSARCGIVTIVNIPGTNTWSESGILTDAGTMAHSAGVLTLGGTLDRIRLNISDTFDAGSIGVYYEI